MKPKKEATTDLLLGVELAKLGTDSYVVSSEKDAERTLWMKSERETLLGAMLGLKQQQHGTGSLQRGQKIFDPDDNGDESGRVVGKFVCGTFSELYVVTKHGTTRETMKMIRLTSQKGHPLRDDERTRIFSPQLREAHIMAQVGVHPNIVGLKAVFCIKLNYYVFFDLVEGRTLQNLLRTARDAKKALSIKITTEIAAKAASGLAFIEQHGVTFWDLKPSHIIVGVRSGPLLAEKEPLHVKIAGFGMATLKGSGVYHGFTPAYGSPETSALHFNNNGGSPRQVEYAGSKQDVWSFGVVFMELLLGQRQWTNHESATKILWQVKTALTAQGKFTEACFAVVRRCMAVDMAKRPSLKTVATDLRRAAGLGGGGGGGWTKMGLLPSAASSLLMKKSKNPDVQTWDERAALHFSLGKAFMDGGPSQMTDAVAAELHFREYQRLQEKKYGKISPANAAALNNIASLFYCQNKLYEAREMYERAIAIGEKTLGKTHPEIAVWLDNLAALYTTHGDLEDAAKCYERSLDIREAALGDDHPRVADSLQNYGLLLKADGSTMQALALFERALEIRETALGPDHPDVADTLNNLALTLTTDHQYDDAKTYYETAVPIYENALGPDHASVATVLQNLVKVLWRMGHVDAAIPILERAIAIRQRRGDSIEAAKLLGHLADLRSGGRHKIVDQTRVFLESSTPVSRVPSSPRTSSPRLITGSQRR